MSTLKFSCLQVTYNCILNRQETYNTIRQLAQKDAKNSGIPTAYVINFNGKTIGLLLYDKPVEWRNLNKMDISDTIKARIQKIYKANINSTIEFLKASDPDIYPSSSNLIFKAESIEVSEIETSESAPTDDKNDIYIKCRNCWSKVLSKNLYLNKGRCIKCIYKKCNAEKSYDKYVELDPQQVIKTSNELMDDFVIFDKKTNMTKEQHLDRINQFENRLDDITLALHILLGKSDKLMVVKQMHLYLIEIGDAEEIYQHHFSPDFDLDNFKNKRMLIYGLTDDIKKTIDKFDKTFRYIGPIKYHKVNLVISVITDSMIGCIKEKNLREKIDENFHHYTFRDKYDSSNTFDDKIFVCNPSEISEISDLIKTI